METESNGRLSPPVSLPRESIGSDGDYDDKLGVPESIKILDMGDGPVAIDNSDDELEDDALEGGLPFTAIHNFIKFKSLNRYVYVPGADVTVQFIDYERHLTTHMINPNLYTISITHSGFTWQIKKRYKDMQNLHQELILFKTGLNIPFPSKTHKNRIRSFKENVPVNKKGKRRGALPRFPKKPELLVAFEKIPNRMKQLEDYLNNLLSIPIYKNHPATLSFFEISHLSFIKDLGLKGKEGIVNKKSGSTNPGQSGCNFFGCYRCLFCLRCQHYCRNFICSRWIKRWFFLKDTCFGYINPNTGQIHSVVLYDQGFEVATGMYSMPLDTGFQVQTLGRSLTFRCHTRRKSKEWVESLKQIAETTARDFIQSNPRRSFAPTRNNTVASWFVDGSSYMSCVADAIEGAKEEIFITDWWLSPQIYLKRPAISGDYWRLDKLLQRKAESGVKIYVLLYKEVELALGLNSFYSKQTLQDLHKNIKVLRHPDHAKVGVFLWAHHEKIVVIDQTYAFVGGIDLCYGRWDDENHRLVDLGSMTPAVDVSTLKKKTSSVPGGDVIYPIPVPYYKRNPIPEENESQSPLIHEETNPDDLPKLNPGDHLLMPQRLVSKPNTPNSEKKNLFGDITEKVRSKGRELINLVYTPSEDEVSTPEYQLEKQESKEENLETADQLINTLDGSAKLWVGKDYVNFIVKDFTNLDAPFDDFIDRVTTPRMPWHDIGVCVHGAAARDVARHFIQRWNSTKLEKAKTNGLYPYLLPKSYNDFKTLPLKFANNTYNVTCQVLRSISTWSGGFLEPDYVEQSIHEAYIETITKAQHYIYIENQFFISLSYNNPNTKNQIGESLYKRIIRAHKEKKKFRVYVVMPLLPGFEGEVGGVTGTSLHAITHWNYASISSGKDAILNRLKEAGIEDPSEYISFYGLRNYSRLNAEPITELIYVHSKLMIADDKIVICGSANINDRSMIGKRDSEVAVIIEDETFVDGIMDGQPCPCGMYAGSLRKYLFKEHLGLLGDQSDTVEFDVADPISDYFYREGWYKTASLNTELYEKVFHSLPSDQVETFVDLKKNNEQKPLWVDEFSRAEKMLEDIQGHLVFLPLNFLNKENLTPAVASVEGFMPTSLWT